MDWIKSGMTDRVWKIKILEAAKKYNFDVVDMSSFQREGPGNVETVVDLHEREYDEKLKNDIKDFYKEIRDITKNLSGTIVLNVGHIGKERIFLELDSPYEAKNELTIKDFEEKIKKLKNV